MQRFASWPRPGLLGFSCFVFSLLGVTLPAQASLVEAPALCSHNQRTLCLKPASQSSAFNGMQHRGVQPLPPFGLEPQKITAGSDFVQSCQSEPFVFNQQAAYSSANAPTAVAQIGYLSIKQQKFSIVVNALRSAVDREPHNSEYYLALGCSLDKLGDHAAAENAYRQAIQLSSNNSAAYFGLGTTLANQQKFRPALLAYIIALTLKPEDPKIYHAVGLVYEKLGKAADATDFFQKANYLTAISQNHERF